MTVMMAHVDSTSMERMDQTDSVIRKDQKNGTHTSVLTVLEGLINREHNSGTTVANSVAAILASWPKAKRQ
jgi:hypothetical protein